MRAKLGLGHTGWVRANGYMALAWADMVERVTRIELALSAWEAD